MPEIPSKERIRAAVLAELRAQESVLLRAVAVASDATTHPDAKAEGKYDTRAIETGYLAGAQAARLRDLQARIAWLDELRLLPHPPDAPIASTSLVGVTGAGRTRHYLILATVGGLSVEIDGHTVHVVTPDSPVGSALVHEHLGSEVELSGQFYEISRVS